MVKIPDGFINSTFEEELLEPGVYTATILKSESGKPKDGGKEYIALTVGVNTGEKEQRWMWDNLSINHSKPFVSRNAQKRLHSILVATGKRTATDTEQLVGCSCCVRIGVRAHWSRVDEEENYIEEYLPVSQFNQNQAGRG